MLPCSFVYVLSMATFCGIITKLSSSNKRLYNLKSQKYLLSARSEKKKNKLLIPALTQVPSPLRCFWVPVTFYRLLIYWQKLLPWKNNYFGLEIKGRDQDLLFICILLLSIKSTTQCLINAGWTNHRKQTCMLNILICLQLRGSWIPRGGCCGRRHLTLHKIRIGLSCWEARWEAFRHSLIENNE